MTHNLLCGKRGLIFGVMDKSSLAWHIAKQCAAEGADLVLTNTHEAVQIGSVCELAESINAEFIECDATEPRQLEYLLKETQRLLAGKIDFVLHAVAQSQNLRRHRTYHDTSYNYFAKTIDTSAMSFHKLMQTAYKNDAIANGGSIVALTYIASERSLDGYNDIADAKAMLESMARNWGRIYGERNSVRVNTISQSPTETRASRGFDGFQKFSQLADNLAPLGNATPQELATLCVAMFSDYMPKITMQNIHNDGGYSKTALTGKFIDFWESQKKS